MKEKLLKLGSYVLVAMLATVVTLAIPGGEGAPSKLEELENLINTRFIGEADETALEDAAAAAMVRATGDRWSYYIPAAEYEAHQERMANAYVGIGITITPGEEGGCLIMSVIPGGPAEEAGLMVGDVLVGVEDQDIRDMELNQVHDLVRGEAGTTVSLSISRLGETMNFTVERRKIQNPVAVYEMLENKVGLVTIANFDSRCAEETIAAIETLGSQGAEKLIFDVRFNPGGYAHEMVKVLDYLLPEGDLFKTVSYDGKEKIDRSDADFLDMPMAVLVNGSSYSAAEFFTAALQEYEAALVVGESTTGKGYFQNTFRLNDGSAVALSTGMYFTPKGENLADRGITPDIQSVVDEETAKAILTGTLDWKQDPQILAALKALEEVK